MPRFIVRQHGDARHLAARAGRSAYEQDRQRSSAVFPFINIHRCERRVRGINSDGFRGVEHRAAAYAEYEFRPDIPRPFARGAAGGDERICAYPVKYIIAYPRALQGFFRVAESAAEPCAAPARDYQAALARRGKNPAALLNAAPADYAADRHIYVAYHGFTSVIFLFDIMRIL